MGIDLGTTNSLVATVKDGQPVVLLDEAERALLPSVVHYGADGGILVGQDARALAEKFPRDTISSVKRFMGRGPKDAEATRQHTPYQFATGDGPVVKLAVAGRGAEPRAVTPIEVSAEILATLHLKVVPTTARCYDAEHLQHILYFAKIGTQNPEPKLVEDWDE